MSTFRRFPPREATQYEGSNPASPRPVAPSLAERVNDGKARASVPVPKNPPLRSRAYRMWVATQPCAHCGRAGPSQCAHSDESKGMGMKSCDSNCFPLCADGPGRQGCHSMFGSAGFFNQPHRRRLEQMHANRTQLTAMSQGVFPAAFEARRQKGLA